MARIYVTTDAFEAETLIENTELNQEPKHKYHDMEFPHGEDLVKRLGFNPMCSVEMNESVSAKELDSIATKLVKEGLYVATEDGENVQRYVPSDISFRNKLVEIALHKERGKRMGEDPCGACLIYSNNPNNIRTFYNSFY